MDRRWFGAAILAAVPLAVLGRTVSAEDQDRTKADKDKKCCEPKPTAEGEPCCDCCSCC